MILNSNGFDDMLNRYEYLSRIQSQDSSIAERVRNLRDQTKETVVRVRAARDEIAAKKAELERTQAELEARQSDLAAARQQDQQALSQVQDTQQRLEGDLSDIQGQIQAQLQAAQAARLRRPRPSGRARCRARARPGSSGRSTGRSHRRSASRARGRPAIPESTSACPPAPRSRRSPTAPSRSPGPEGGYGNYTCIDHGGGLSSCYAHQESIAVSVGEQVSQGQVIGISDCTGLCFGPHLHFEVRVNGQVVDPMGYLP